MHHLASHAEVLSPAAVATGFASSEGPAPRHLPGEDVRSVLRNARVAKYASPVEEKKYGTSKIDVVIDYLEAKHGRPARGRIPVDFAKLRIATKRGSLPFAGASAQQIRDATRALGKSAKRLKTSPVVRAIVACVPREAKEITVHYSDGHVSVGKIPVRLYGAVMRALRSDEVKRIGNVAEKSATLPIGRGARERAPARPFAGRATLLRRRRRHR